MLNLNCHTIREIAHQPKMWMDTYDIVMDRKQDIEEFLSANSINKDTEIILTGAGSSAYIADTAVCEYMKAGFVHAKAVATTDIVSAPSYFLSPSPKLFISFGRSGNSPESVAAYEVANKCCPGSHHLIITCNPDGELAKRVEPGKDLVIVLPDGTNDRSLAMTSSFTSMLVTSLLCKNVKTLAAERAKLQAAADFAESIIAGEAADKIAKLAEKKIKRAVFLGSGPLKGIACESHLKLQELTDGGIVCAFDSFMGLRHGPKAVINEETLVVYLLSEDPYTRQYELDLIEQVEHDNHPAAQVVLSVTPSGVKDILDFEINAPQPEALKDNEYVCAPFVLVGQLAGYFFSLDHGLSPDNPSVRGAISRVVSGVKIYKY
ncbi:MAG: SIS domain-containing protein [Bacteroidales bacterium]|nr:SIS domain-containing protein [Bacteroidales bacterium]